MRKNKATVFPPNIRHTQKDLIQLFLKALVNERDFNREPLRLVECSHKPQKKNGTF